MKVSRRTFFCRACRKFTHLSLPTGQRSCGYCGESLLILYQEGDFADVDDPGVIGNWLKVTGTRYFGLDQPQL